VSKGEATLQRMNKKRATTITGDEQKERKRE
jgi:hypothetical protein